MILLQPTCWSRAPLVGWGTTSSFLLLFPELLSPCGGRSEAAWGEGRLKPCVWETLHSPEPLRLLCWDRAGRALGAWGLGSAVRNSPLAGGKKGGLHHEAEERSCFIDRSVLSTDQASSCPLGPRPLLFSSLGLGFFQLLYSSSGCRTPKSSAQ